MAGRKQNALPRSDEMTHNSWKLGYLAGLQLCSRPAFEVFVLGGGEPDVCGCRIVDRRGIKMYFYSRSSLDPGSVYVEPPSNRMSPLHHAILARAGEGAPETPYHPLSQRSHILGELGLPQGSHLLYISARALLKHSTSRARTQLDK